MTGSLLSARGLGRRATDAAQGPWLVRDVSLELRPGESVALRGPSGAGKSVLLRALAGLDPLDAGEIAFCDAPLAALDMPAYRAQVMYLHQRPAIGEGPAEDALRAVFRLKVHKARRYDRDRIVRYLERLGRDADLLGRDTGHLSGGEQQIIAFLRALQLDPRVLLLDEPTASLDAPTAGAIEALVGVWRAEDPARAVLWVTHDAEQPGRVASRLLALRDGRMVGAEGAP